MRWLQSEGESCAAAFRSSSWMELARTCVCVCVCVAVVCARSFCVRVCSKQQCCVSGMEVAREAVVAEQQQQLE